MTVNISSLQTELLKLLSNDKEIPMETVFNQSFDVDEVVNKDLKGGENIAAMTENLLTGGDLDNGASSKEIVSNILMDDKKETENKPADIIEQIIEKEKDVNDNMEGGEKKKQTKFNESSDESESSDDDENESSESTDESDESDTEQNKNDAQNENDEFNDEQQAKSDSDEPNDELKNSMLNLSSDYDDSDSYDDSDNENLSSSYISIINEFSTPATKKKLTGGLVNSSSSRVKVIPMFPYIIKTEPL